LRDGLGLAGCHTVDPTPLAGPSQPPCRRCYASDRRFG
jgi:hypothetical protein